MEGEARVTPSEATQEKSLWEAMDELCVFYITLGVSQEEFWRGDPTLLPLYYKANESRARKRQREIDYEAWLQGRYCYEAVCRAAPLFNVFAKRAEAKPYLEEPYLVKHDREQTETPEQIKEEFLAKWRESKAQWKKTQKPEASQNALKDVANNDDRRTANRDKAKIDKRGK